MKTVAKFGMNLVFVLERMTCVSDGKHQFATFDPQVVVDWGYWESTKEFCAVSDFLLSRHKEQKPIVTCKYDRREGVIVEPPGYNVVGLLPALRDQYELDCLNHDGTHKTPNTIVALLMPTGGIKGWGLGIKQLTGCLFPSDGAIEECIARLKKTQRAECQFKGQCHIVVLDRSSEKVNLKLYPI